MNNVSLLNSFDPDQVFHFFGPDLYPSCLHRSADNTCRQSSGLPRSGKKFWKMKSVPGQGKVREFHFQSGKFRKNEKSHGKAGNFKNFKKIAS